jgi:hypothetical protein
MPRLSPYLTSLASAFALALPALAGHQSITIHGTEGFDPTAVATFVTKFEGELHTLDITIEDSTVELDVTTENPTNGLWHIESTRPDGATFYLADASANQDHSSSFIFKQQTQGGGGGGGGGGNKTYEAISQQIQIFASYPGEPEVEVPRPTTQGDAYRGLILRDNLEKPVLIRLVYNREDSERFDPSFVILEVADGLKIVGRPPGQDNPAAIAAELHPGTEVTFEIARASVLDPDMSAPQPVTLILIDQFGAIHEDEVVLDVPYVREVSFSIAEGEGDSNHLLSNDEATTFYAAPHWIDKDGDGEPSDGASGERNYAVAYKRNTTPHVEAHFKLVKLPHGTAVSARASGTNGVSIPPSPANFRNDGVHVLEAVPTENPWPDTVKFYDRSDAAKAFTLEWELKIGDADWLPIGKTKHQVYLTLNNRTTAKSQESLYYMGSKAADGAVNKSSVTDLIWSIFTEESRNVTRVDGKTLHYYKSYTNQNTDTFTLLKHQDGQCGAWVKLFADIMKAQGLEDNYNIVQIKADSADEGFLVKNWSDDGSGLGTEEGYPFVNVYSHEDLVGFLKDDHYEWLYSDVQDEAGERGQGQSNPASLFFSHIVLAYDGKYFDPSYGSIYDGTGLEEIDSAIYGFIKRKVLVFSDNSQKNSFQIRKNANEVEVKVDVIISY